ncbi:MAG: FtsW/RodA/SpoVE family cell cycle protein [Thermoleophilia bacterium]|nr:FtsW/RodA/SpoVE family cell cycle protein [Thermoleophilia bacterium]
MSARNRELVFLVPALILTTLGFALVYTQKASLLTLSSLTYGGLFLVLFLIAHIGRRVLAPKADPVLLPVTALLSTLGIVLLYRLNEKLALRQAMWLVVGLAAFLLVLVLVRRLQTLANLRYVLGGLGLLLLLITAVLGREINGAKLWVHLGPVNFQPGELAKILLILFFAAYLVDMREVLTVSTHRVLGVPLPPFRYLAPLVAIWGLSMVLVIFVKDLGTGLLFFGALLALLYVATGRLFYVLVGLALFIVGAFGLYYLFPHVQARVDIWLDPWQDPSGRGYQVVQSLFALAEGGLFGRGLGQGYLLLPSGKTIIPNLETDFIFSAIGEELGLAGAAAIILLYLIFTYRGFRVAVRARDDFSRLLATGLTSIFALQAFLIIGGVTKLIPLTGITLPFVSYGGSSIVANFILLALLLRTSNEEENFG